MLPADIRKKFHPICNILIVRGVIVNGATGQLPPAKWAGGISETHCSAIIQDGIT